LNITGGSPDGTSGAYTLPVRQAITAPGGGNSAD